MSRKGILACVWGGMYVLCAALGFINTNNGLLQALFAILSVGFFIPGGILLYEAVTEKDKKTVRWVRYLSLASLVLTVLTVIGSVLSLPGGDAAGMRMHILLGIISAPMFSSQWWAISLFLWACLLMGSFFGKTKKSK